MPALRYRCPATSDTVEVWTEFEDDPADGADSFFDTVVCSLCGRVHLVDLKTGRVVGE